MMTITIIHMNKYVTKQQANSYLILQLHMVKIIILCTIITGLINHYLMIIQIKPNQQNM